MGTSSHQVRELLDRIGRGSVPTAGEVTAIGREAVVRKEPGIVAALLHLLHYRDVCDAAINAIEDVIRATPPLRLLRLDRELRERSEYSWPALSTWRSMFFSGPSMHELKRLTQGSAACLGVIASHPDGRVRETAVRALADTRTGGELPFLLIRLNDWVRQVRDASRDAVLARLETTDVLHFVRCLPLVFHLDDQGRADRDVQRLILSMLRRPEVQPELLLALRSGDRDTARLAFEWLRDVPDALLQDLIEGGLRSRDPVLRLYAARLAHERVEGDVLRAVLHRLGSDRFMPVRRQILFAFHEKLPAEAPQQLRGALFDPHAAVREAARFLLRQRGETPPASIYGERLAEAVPRQLPTLIAALGEVGEGTDVPAIRRFLDHPVAAVRVAAVRACARLDGDPLADVFLRLLRDDVSGKVSRAAREALRPRRHVVGFDRIWAIVEGGARPQTRCHALRLLADRDWWTSIEYFLRAVVLDDGPLRALAREFIERRRHELGRFTRRPADGQMRSIASALDAAVPHVDAAFIEDVRYGMEYVRGNFPAAS